MASLGWSAIQNIKLGVTNHRTRISLVCNWKHWFKITFVHRRKNFVTHMYYNYTSSLQQKKKKKQMYRITQSMAADSNGFVCHLSWHCFFRISFFSSLQFVAFALASVDWWKPFAWASSRKLPHFSALLLLPPSQSAIRSTGTAAAAQWWDPCHLLTHSHASSSSTTLCTRVPLPTLHLDSCNTTRTCSSLLTGWRLCLLGEVNMFWCTTRFRRGCRRRRHGRPSSGSAYKLRWPELLWKTLLHPTSCLEVRRNE